MSEGLRKKIVFAALPLAILWAVFNYSSDAPETPVETPSAVDVQTVLPATVTEVPDARMIDIGEKLVEPWGEDPFYAPAKKAVLPGGHKQPTWTLGGIVYSYQTPMAYVNMQVVRVGDRVGGATVMSIYKKSVVLDVGGRKITLKLNRG